MNLFRRYRYPLLFLAVLVFCSVMIIRQLQQNRARHVDRREAFILLFIKGYRSDASLLYDRLLLDLPRLSNAQLIEDFQRTLQVVDPTAKQEGNLVYNYHWAVSQQLEVRANDILERAKKLAKDH